MSENSYRRIADEYLREYGAQLRAELEVMDRVAYIRNTFSLDHRVRSALAALKRQRYFKYAGLIAACVVAALSTTFVLWLSPGRIVTPGTNAPGSVSSPQAPSSSASASPSGTPAEAYEIIPLAFKLPGQFSVASVEQDMGRTVYRLNDVMRDDVVLTLERSGDISQYDTLTEISIGGHSVFGSSGNGYSLLAFIDAENDIMYTLTCKHDVNTLVLLGYSILI